MRLSFYQARECIFEIYKSRGYYGVEEAMKMLSELDLISLRDRSELNNLIISVEMGEQQKSSDRHKKTKYLKNL